MKVKLNQTVTLTDEQLKGAKAYKDALEDDMPLRDFIKDIIFHYGYTPATMKFEEYAVCGEEL